MKDKMEKGKMQKEKRREIGEEKKRRKNVEEKKNVWNETKEEKGKRKRKN